MTATGTFGLSSEARNLHWLLGNLVEEVPGVRSVAVVSSDGLLLLSSDPAQNAASTAAPAGRVPGAPAPTSPPSCRASAASPSAPPG